MQKIRFYSLSISIDNCIL